VLSCLITLSATQSAFAKLQIELVEIENPRQPGAPLVRGGGQLSEIMQVAAENWERIFKHGSGNWKVTIEYGWSNLAGLFFGKEYYVSERGNNPSRIGQSYILFNLTPILDASRVGYFADPSPWDNSEYLAYTADTINTGYGWLNGSSISRAESDTSLVQRMRWSWHKSACSIDRICRSRLSIPTATAGRFPRVQCHPAPPALPPALRL